jgi:hypothetical protein
MPSSLTLAGQEAVGRSPRDSIASRLLDTAGTSLAHRHKRPTPRGVTAFQGLAALPADLSDADLEAL